MRGMMLLDARCPRRLSSSRRAFQLCGPRTRLSGLWGVAALGGRSPSGRAPPPVQRWALRHARWACSLRARCFLTLPIARLQTGHGIGSLLVCPLCCRAGASCWREAHPGPGRASSGRAARGAIQTDCRQLSEVEQMLPWSLLRRCAALLRDGPGSSALREGPRRGTSRIPRMRCWQRLPCGSLSHRRCLLATPCWVRGLRRAWAESATWIRMGFLGRWAVAPCSFQWRSWGWETAEEPEPAARGVSPAVRVPREVLAQELLARFPEGAEAWLLGRSRRGLQGPGCVWRLWPLPPTCRCLRHWAGKPGLRGSSMLRRVHRACHLRTR